ncbi:hypothetical protein RO3G_15063 [Rhizopus delemar RA 99-880]|uniref:Uncharacterized protein n=1 Tax=Rhizopus delemar (strain RA 99-880 / ATCC MYA-4621 / FGSC 9543 / NRRL 43880) TaxID=246409 RepID=I1CPH2_RHIO9|nr:hypothetical protein RO3G_15063 [Rhizopus delemar RA 99-880]|eukprot:EIE90352.1 hypothetical protein RO3G_15063 [Rhizopus delemar RA 99-880]
MFASLGSVHIGPFQPTLCAMYDKQSALSTVLVWTLNYILHPKK